MPCILFHLLKHLCKNSEMIKCDILLPIVKSFCETCNIDVPNMNACYVERAGLAHHQQDDFTIKHHYRVDFLCYNRFYITGI